MSKTDVSKFFKMAQHVITKYSPEILTGIGIAGMITTTVLAVKATPKALEKIEEEKKRVYDELDPLDVPSQAIPQDVKLKPMEVVKVSWKYYIPAVITGTASIACIIGASKVNYTRNAALATAYNLSQTALTEYKTKVIETIGEKKEQVVREKVAKEQLEKNPVIPSKEIIVTSGDKQRFYEVMGNQRFSSTVTDIERIVNGLNRRMRDEMYISLNELYLELGLKPAPIGDIVGWNIDKGYIELSFDSLIDTDGTACIVMDYLVRPTYGFDAVYGI